MTHMARTADAASVEVVMEEMGRRARASARILSITPTAAKNAALGRMASEIRVAMPEILAANALDVADGRAKGLSGSFVDRLTLTPDRVEAMAKGLEDIAALADPVGRVLAAWDRPNGLHIERVATPLGVVGIIYESRPNVTADAGALCLKAGNAAILRGGSDALRSSTAIVAALRRGLAATGLPEDAVQLVPVADRAAVGAMLAGGLHGIEHELRPEPEFVGSREERPDVLGQASAAEADFRHSSAPMQSGDPGRRRRGR